MINLLPYKEKRSIERVRSIRLFQTVIISAITICIIGLILLLPTLLTVRNRFTIASNQIASLERGGALATDLDIASLEARARAANLKLSVPPESSPMTYIETTRSLAPSGISIDRFALAENKMLEVSGVAKNREALQAFVDRLQKNETVSKVDSPVSNFIKSANSLFKITIVFK